MSTMAGEHLIVAGIPLRLFSFADWAMLRRAGSMFLCAKEDQVEDNVLEAVMLFLYLTDAHLTVDEAMEKVFNTERIPLLKEAIIAMSARIEYGSMPVSDMVDAIEKYIADCRKTRVEVIPENRPGNRKKKAGSSPSGPSSP